MASWTWSIAVSRIDAAASAELLDPRRLGRARQPVERGDEGHLLAPDRGEEDLMGRIHRRRQRRGQLAPLEIMGEEGGGEEVTRPMQRQLQPGHAGEPDL